MNPKAEQLRRSWIENAGVWRDTIRSGGLESRRLVTDRAVLDAIRDQSPRTVLDVGCGEGWLARALAADGVQVTGVDASEPLIEAARELGGGEFLCASYDELPAVLAGRSFDVVVANFALLDDRLEQVLAALHVLGGRLVIQTVHPAFAGAGEYADGWRVETFEAFPGEWPTSMPWYFRTLESWSAELARSGYRIEEIREPMHPHRGVPASIIFICR